MDEDRFNKVEVQVGEVRSQVLEVKAQLNYVVMTQQRHDNLLEAITNQSTLLGNTAAVQTEVVKAITARTDVHQKEIEKLQSDQVDIGKALASHTTDITSMKRMGGIGAGAIVSLIVGYLLSHFIR